MQWRNLVFCVVGVKTYSPVGNSKRCSLQCHFAVTYFSMTFLFVTGHLTFTVRCCPTHVHWAAVHTVTMQHDWLFGHWENITIGLNLLIIFFCHSNHFALLLMKFTAWWLWLCQCVRCVRLMHGVWMFVYIFHFLCPVECTCTANLCFAEDCKLIKSIWDLLHKVFSLFLFLYFSLFVIYSEVA